MNIEDECQNTGKEQEIAEKIKEHGVSGNVRREKYDSSPLIRMTNTFISPDPNGVSSKEEMAAKIPKNKKGLYVETVNGGWVDPDQGTFCIEVNLGWLIENGLITDKPVKNIKVTGNISKFMNSIKGIGNEKTLGIFSGYCGKDGQWVARSGYRIKRMQEGGIHAN